MGRVRRAADLHPGQQGGALVRGETRRGSIRGITSTPYVFRFQTRWYRQVLVVWMTCAAVMRVASKIWGLTIRDFVLNPGDTGSARGRRKNADEKCEGGGAQGYPVVRRLQGGQSEQC